MIDLHSIIVLHHPPILKLLVNLVLTKGMLDVVILYRLRPVVIKVVNLASHITTVF